MIKKIKKVRIVPGCISCGSCEAICPSVFEVTDIARVIESANPNQDADLVREAADMCPVSVIQVDEESE
ncbi:ferredoxin [Candidatus Dependentiae bacterium]|nr:ferredoxin [Candidatus Dependentiae bacterium]